MRTLVWGWGLASGNRERGKAAGCEGDGTDERGPLVSVRVRERGSTRHPLGPAWAEQSGPACGPIPNRAAVSFLFLFMQFLLNV